MKFFLTIALCSLSWLLYAQEAITVEGKVVDSESEDPLVGANVFMKGMTVGTVTNKRGDFRLSTLAKNLPMTITVSVPGYATEEVQVNGPTNILIVRLDYQALMTGEELVVSASRVEESILESPVSVEKMGILDIQSAATPSFYDQMANLKGIDVNRQSLIYTAINPRGFGTTGNTRVVQLIDGVDNIAPVAGFSPGNVIGIPELDVESVEVLPGAASALYGPNALNGIILMNSKNPFEYQGLSANAKLGVTHLDGKDDDPSLYQSYGIRYARAFNDRLAIKVTGEWVRAADFRAVDYRNRQDLVSDNVEAVDPLDREGRRTYDGVNVYGEPLVNLGAIAQSNPALAPVRDLLPSDQTGDFTPTGYPEPGLLDNTAKNTKLIGAVHYRLNDKVEAIAQYTLGTGTMNFFHLDRNVFKDFVFQTARAELQGTNFFLRAYNTNANIESYGTDGLASLVNAQSTIPRYVEAFTAARLQGLTVDQAHGEARTASDALRAENLENGRFQQLFDSLRQVPTSQGGAQFVDRTSIQHYEGMYNFAELTDVADIIVGGNFRRYLPVTEGTLFALRDDGREFTINEWGVYTQASKDFFNEQLNLTASLRYDKNENFDGQFSPRVSGVYTFLDQHNVRASFQRAFRIPTLQDQLIDIRSGNTRSVGGIRPLIDRYRFSTNVLYSAASVAQARENFRNTGDVAGAVTLLEPVSPENLTTEKVSTYEIGYRGVFNGNLIDAYYYYSAYTDFSTRLSTIQSAGPDNDPSGDGRPPFGGEANPEGIVQNTINVQSFLTTISSTEVIATHGFAIGIDYALNRGFVVGGNVSYNALLNQDELEAQGLNPFFNTPEWRYNLKVMNRKVTDNFGFSLFWHGQSAFIWDTEVVRGKIPAYQTLDAQASYKIPALKTILSIGGANILNERYTNAISNVRVGAIYYVSLTFDQFLN